MLKAVFLLGVHTIETVCAEFPIGVLAKTNNMERKNVETDLFPCLSATLFFTNMCGNKNVL